MVNIKLNKDDTLTVTFKNLTKGKFMNLVRALNTLATNEGSTLARETFDAVKQAAANLGFSDLLND